MFDSISTGKYWDVGLSVIEGCSPIRCTGCWAASASYMRQNNKMVAHRHEGLTVKKNDGSIHFNGNIKIFEKELDRPRSRKAQTAYQIWTDLFHYHVPDSTIQKAFDTFSDCGRHIFFVLTQRPERMETFLKAYYGSRHDQAPLPNVIVGTTIRDVMDIPRADHLCSTPAAARFISAEPLRGLLVLIEWFQSKLIDGIIIGGGTAANKEQTNPVWAESLVNQALHSNVNVFFKSWGNYGKRIPGSHIEPRIILGKSWNQLPVIIENGIYRVKSIREE